MNHNVHKKSTAKQGKTSNPNASLIGKTFIVQCATFRCAAFVDQKGKWRGYYDGKELQGPVNILREF